MMLRAVFANLSCGDLDRSRGWYETLFDRQADDAPMDGLLEWHHGDRAGFQLFHDPGKAGKGTLTLIVGGLEHYRSRLVAAGFESGAIERGGRTHILRLSDPDGNLVVLAEPQ